MNSNNDEDITAMDIELTEIDAELVDAGLKVIGLTGGIGTGKSIATAYLRKKNYTVFDADEIARESVLPGEPALDKLVEIFGSEILTEEGMLNRGYLADIVFSSDENVKILNSIMHADIVERIEKYLKRRKSNIAKTKGNTKTLKTVFLSAPLLLEGETKEFCDEIWLITADDDIRISRAAIRDGVDKEKIKDRIQFQMSEEEKKGLVDVVIENNGSEEELYKKLEEALKKRV